MSNSRLTKAKQLLQQARILLNQVQGDIRERRFSSDDIRMETYNDLIKTVFASFPEDPILGQMVIIPDANIRSLDWEYLVKFPQVPSQRIETYLTRLINRLEILLGEEPAQQLIDKRDFSFVADRKLREVLRLDFIEAQTAFIAEAYKACGLLCGALIEGMLLGIVQRRSGQPIEQDRVGMTDLIKMASKLRLVGDRALRFAEGARDIRDTVHPRAEVRQGGRVSKGEAELLFQLVKVIYDDLGTRFSEGEMND